MLAATDKFPLAFHFLGSHPVLLIDAVSKFMRLAVHSIIIGEQATADDIPILTVRGVLVIRPPAIIVVAGFLLAHTVHDSTVISIHPVNGGNRSHHAQSSPPTETAAADDKISDLDSTRYSYRHG